MHRKILSILLLLNIVLSQENYFVCDSNDVDKYEDISADEGDPMFEVSYYK